MAYVVFAKFTYAWVGDGIGFLSGPYGGTGSQPTGLPAVQGAGAQGIPVFSGYTQVPGGDAPTLANLNTALSTAATQAQSMLTANNNALATAIQNWATGGG